MLSDYFSACRCQTWKHEKVTLMIPVQHFRVRESTEDATGTTQACCSTPVCWHLPYVDGPTLFPKPLEAVVKGQNRQRPLPSCRALCQYSPQSMPTSNCRGLGMSCPLCQPGPRGWELVSAGNKPTFPWRALGSSCLALATVWPERSLPQKLFL